MKYLCARRVYLSVWTWFATRRAFAVLDLQEKYKQQGFIVLGVAMDEEGKSAVVPFVQDERCKLGTELRPMNYPIVIGNDDTAEKLEGLLGLPTTILISQDHRRGEAH